MLRYGVNLSEAGTLALFINWCVACKVGLRVPLVNEPKFGDAPSLAKIR